ncbi:LysR family transcriptional regulator [Rhodoferax sp. U11-2br]|uniref:LysR family transcriptional regulator n=1 Tax=Rhodoferax sp. U11-2br TaxID=2838878 RepID=UPI001BE6A45C|nr:LysR family transcriptional regulator [Rhodoferax sp. U11-2br]MBT3065645.1 LysR family transcriptional regulator [Rhodoferax sp. U11-2br]
MDRLLSMRVFQKVIDEGGFAAASRALDISPAVVTRLVADLEDHLGTRLLHRSTRRLSLSVAGEAYLARVRLILQDIDEADSLASSQTHEPEGILRVLAPPVLATHVLAPLIADFRQLHPKIQLNIEVASFKEPPIEDYDITLLPTEADFDADLIARKISATEAILVASPAYIQRKNVPVVPQDLAHHEVLRLTMSSRPQGTWRLFNSARQDEALDVAVQPVLWSNHTDTLMRAVLDGAGITSVAVDLAAPYLSSGQLIRVLRPWITGRLAIYAALPSRQFLPERTRVFLEFLTERTRREASSAVLACEAC